MKYRINNYGKVKYPSDMTTKQWNIIKPLLENEKRGKHLEPVFKKNILLAIMQGFCSIVTWQNIIHKNIAVIIKLRLFLKTGS